MDLQLARLGALLAEKKLALDITPAAKLAMVAEGYDPVFGARPLKRVIQRRLQNPLALAVLEGRFTENQTVLVDVAESGELVFTRAEGGVA